MKKCLVIALLLTAVCTSSFAGTLINDERYMLAFPIIPYVCVYNAVNMTPGCLPFSNALDYNRYGVGAGYTAGDGISTAYFTFMYALSSYVNFFMQVGNWSPDQGDGSTSVQGGGQIRLKQQFAGWNMRLSGAYSSTSPDYADLTAFSGQVSADRASERFNGIRYLVGGGAAFYDVSYDFGMGSIDDDGLEIGGYGGAEYTTPIPGLTVSGTGGLQGGAFALNADAKWKINF